MNKIVSWVSGVKVTSYTFLCVFSAFAFAAKESAMPFNLRYLVDLSFGPAWISGAKQNPQTFNQNTDLEVTFLHNKGSNSPVFNGEQFLGVQKPVTSNLMGQIGLVVAETSTVAVNGSIWSGPDSTFHKFNYKYRLSHTDVGIKGKLIYDSALIMNPYVSAGIGMNFNQALGLDVSSLSNEETFNPSVENQSSSSFMYQVGVGLHEVLNTHWLLSIGYQFKYIGQSHLNVDGNQLSSGAFYLNIVKFEIAYLI
jgi:opacity protein-like surface antigen